MSDKRLRKCSFCKAKHRWAKTLRDGRQLCRACEVCGFFERYLTLTGDYAGQPFTLMPWTRQVLRDVFGTLDDDGLRQYRDIYLEVPKKNTKTTFCAGLVLYCLASSTNSGTEVYSAATSKDQAAHVFRAACQMVNRNATLTRRLRIIDSSKRILRRDDATISYAAISADGDIHDGIQPAFVVRDELHRWRTRKALELNEILERGMITRREPLVIDITTAGEANESPLCWRRHEYARQVGEGTLQDRRFYGKIWAADLQKYDWRSREARRQANPSHEDNGGYLTDSAIEDLCIKAQNDPRAKNDYLRYHLNVWSFGHYGDPAIDMGKWQAAGGSTDLRTWPMYDVERLVSEWDLRGRECYAGIDASWTTDLTALALIFPPEADEGQWTLVPFVWLPEEKVKEREFRDKVPYSEWVRRGFLEATPGSAVDQDAIVERLDWARDKFDLRDVAFDPWNFKATAQRLERQGYLMVDIPQNYGHLSEATKKLLELIETGQLRHGNNPVANYCASCLNLQGDRKDNVQPAKPERLKSSKRIDVIAAAIDALARVVRLKTAVDVDVRLVG